MNDDVDRYEQLKFTVQKASILDNHIRSLQLKKLRLYLVDAEYSLVVFTIGVTEYKYVKLDKRNCKESRNISHWCFCSVRSIRGLSDTSTSTWKAMQWA